MYDMQDRLLEDREFRGDMEEQCVGTPELDKLDNVWTLVVVTLVLSCCYIVCGGVLKLLARIGRPGTLSIGRPPMRRWTPS